MTPKDQISAFEVQDSAFRTSGAMQIGEPSMVFVMCYSGSSPLQSPKSANLSFPLWNRIFSGFKSRCSTLYLFKVLQALRISRTYLKASAYGNFLTFFNFQYRLPPLQKSQTKQWLFLVLISSQKETIFSHLPIFDRILTSFTRHSSALGLSIRSWFSITFMANSPGRLQWVALNTSPELPLPTHYSRVYPYIFRRISKMYKNSIPIEVSSQYNQKIFCMASWYGKTSAKELDGLIDKKAKLSELLLYPDFINELKAYNSKLLEYFTNNPNLMAELVEFIAVPPLNSDSDERKYKFPLMAIEAIETETTCIHNGLFKQSQNGQTYFQNMFKLLDAPEVLPLLAGYLFRANICLLNNRQKETIDKIYSMPQVFSKLIDHSYLMSITNIIQLFLNLDLNKHMNPSQNENRVKIKLQVLQEIITKIEIQSGLRNEKSTTIIENLCGILCETVDKYFLIINGKQMMDVITSQKTISLFMSMIKSPFFSENAFPAFNFFISLINYYSFSQFNVDDLNTEDGKKNLERLESQPMIAELINYFPSALDRIMRSPVMNLYLFRLLQVLCHCISISSLKIFECTRKTQFFYNLVKLMFIHERHNILHVLIEKSFLHIFISDRKIYQEYKKHLFCEIDIIDATAGYFMKQFPLEKLFEEGKKKAYFGHFMRILKIYSGIQTEDQSIIQAIRSKSELWNKISKHLIIPFENIYEKKLGTYEQVPEAVYQQFKVDKNLKIKTNPMKNSTIEQINKEQNVPAGLKTQIQTDLYTKMQQMQQKKAQQMFYRTPIQGFLANNEIISQTSSSIANAQKPPLPTRPNNHMSQSNVVDYQTSNSKEMKKSESFKEFMDKKKVEAEQEIKLKRSLSHEKRLSGNKAKLSSPSPSKKNSWKQQTSDQLTNKSSQAQKKAVPKIPLNRKQSGQGSVSDRLYVSAANTPTQPQTQTQSSMTPMGGSQTSANLNTTGNRSLVKDQIVENGEVVDIRKIRIFQIQKPAEKKYRRVEKRDQVLFNFLGLTI